MRNKGGKQRLSIIKLLGIGGGILLICLFVCIYMVSLMKDTYSSDVSSEFQENHENAAKVVDNLVEDWTDIVEAAARTMENTVLNNAKIGNVVEEYAAYTRFDKFVYLSAEEEVYDGEQKNAITKLTLVDREIYEKVLSEGKTCTFLETVEEDPDEQAQHLLSSEQTILVHAKPVKKDNEVRGYMVAQIDVSELFGMSAFDYQNSLGECYLLNKTGEILLRSSGATRISADQTDFQNGIMDYSGGKESAKQQLLAALQEMKKGNSGFITIKTADNDSLQISYCSLESISNVYLVSCYDDNLVDDSIHPLIINSVISCIVIIVLMIIVILFVWSSSKNANLVIEKLAYEDSVTKGRNINFFKEFAVNVLSVYREIPFVIYRFDISNFRYINEAYGHQKADEVLKSCIRNFKSIFADNELCVRMNADQFLAIIVNDNTVNQRLAQYYGKVNMDARTVGIKYPIRFKTGIYQCKKHESDIDVMIDHANVARKSLSGDEKEMTAVYSDRIITNMQKMNRIESDQQHALATGEFKVFLQPKWDIVKDHICGAEALVRWIKADGSMVYPDEFIPVFENNGFVEKLDFYMLEMVCQQIRMLIDVGRAVYPVSVNQSRLLLHSPDYVSNVERILKKYNIPQNLIELEITETVFLDERELMIDTMSNLKQCGVKLSMDDFGSGYSSLNMLKDIPFDVIKIDREFFSESVNSASSQWILQKIVEMTAGLGMEVICEGVETIEQIEFLKKIGCHKVQGYYYSKPIPSMDFVTKYCEPVNGKK